MRIDAVEDQRQKACCLFVCLFVYLFIRSVKPYVLHDYRSPQTTIYSPVAQRASLLRVLEVVEELLGVALASDPVAESLRLDRGDG